MEPTQRPLTLDEVAIGSMITFEAWGNKHYECRVDEIDKEWGITSSYWRWKGYPHWVTEAGTFRNPTNIQQVFNLETTTTKS